MPGKYFGELFAKTTEKMVMALKSGGSDFPGADRGPTPAPSSDLKALARSSLDIITPDN